MAEDIERGTIAYALSNYAREQMVMFQTESEEGNRKKHLEKSIAAITKALGIYELPIYLYDLACFMEMGGQLDTARNLFEEFLKKQSQFQPGRMENLFLGLNNRDIDEATKDAQAKVI